MDYLDHPHIKEWLEQHDHRILGREFSRAFHAYLETLPWEPSRIDWSELESVAVEIPDEQDPEFLQACRRTLLGRHKFTLITYNENEDSLLCATDVALRNIDLLYMRAPGPRYFCGTDAAERGDVSIAAKDFAEYDISGLTFRVDLAFM